MAELPPPPEGIVLAHFIVADDVERSRRFYTEVLGGRLVFSGDVTYVALANSWIIINVGGGPTDDKPGVTLRTPDDPDLASSFLNTRVSDIHAVERARRAVPHDAKTAPVRDPLLHTRPGRVPDRGRPDHPAGRLAPVPEPGRAGLARPGP